MTWNEKMELICRILSEYRRCEVGQEVFFLRVPSPQIVYECNIVYNKSLNRFRFDDFYSSETITSLMRNLEYPCFDNDLLKKSKKDVEYYMWSKDMEKELERLGAVIDNQKVELYDNVNGGDELHADQTRKNLHLSRVAYNALFQQKHRLDRITGEHVATLMYYRELYSQTLYDSNKNQIHNPDPILIKLVSEAIDREDFSVTLLRELAKTDPWRSKWATLKPNPFDGFLTDERTTLAMYSRLYDDVRGRHDAPPDQIIEEDDCFDGWIIKERRKHEQEQIEKQDRVERRQDDGREIFVMAKTKDEANLIYNKNNPTVRANIKRRFDAIAEHGVLKDSQLPDVQEQLKLKFHKQELERRRKT